MTKKLLLAGLALSALGLMQATPAIAAAVDQASSTQTTTAIQATPPADAANVVAAPVDVQLQEQSTRDGAPQTSSTLTVIVLIGCVGICLASLLMQFRKPTPVRVVS
jgi:predicted cobalt transporter CbtA